MGKLFGSFIGIGVAGGLFFLLQPHWMSWIAAAMGLGCFVQLIKTLWED